MGNQQGVHDHEEREIKTSEATNETQAGLTISEETETEKTIDKYQVTETEEKTLEVSTMATDSEVSDDIVPPSKPEPEGKDKDTLYVDIEEVGEGTKPGEKSPFMKSPKYEETKEKALETPVDEEKEKPSDVTVGEREMLLSKETSGTLSESVSNTPNEKVRKLNSSSSLFRSCMCCIQATS